MPQFPIDFTDRHFIAYGLLALIAVTGTALTARYVRWRRAEHRRRYGIGPRPEHRRGR
jgi:hypothetical protein